MGFEPTNGGFAVRFMLFSMGLDGLVSACRQGCNKRLGSLGPSPHHAVLATISATPTTSHVWITDRSVPPRQMLFPAGKLRFASEHRQGAFE